MSRFPQQVHTAPHTRTSRFAPAALALFGALAALFCAAPVSGGPQKLASKECIACHAPVLKEASKKFVHAPFKDEKNCESCHKRHGVVGALVLKEEEPALCLSCHPKEDAAMKAAHAHAPVKEGKCSSCHAPHASEFKGLLKANGNEACFSCHKKEEFTLANVHKP